jgi:hypothetical protein
VNPIYPVYILSYDRWQDTRRLTIKEFERIGVPYTVVVEPEEKELYAQVISEKNIKVLPQKYHYEFDACVPREPNTRQGSGPVRNFIWDDSIKRGFKRHWVFDDNVGRFYRVNNNMKVEVADGTIFRVMEEFVDRYENVALAGPNYETFVHRKEVRPPFNLNTRIYSMLLIKNNIPYRWRARYNDDTDLSLRVLKDGWCTILFNAFLGRKAATQTVKGGLTDQIYLKEGTIPKSRLLAELHPDVVKIVWRFNRVHHYIDYRQFQKNKLIKRVDVDIPEGIDDFGMTFEKREKDGK